MWKYKYVYSNSHDVILMLILLYFLHCLLHIYEYMKSTSSQMSVTADAKVSMYCAGRILLYYYYNKIHLLVGVCYYCEEFL